MTTNERLNQLIDNKKKSSEIRNNAHFADLTGVQTGYLSEVLSGKRNLTERFAHKIITAFPQIDKNWLLTGEGSMLKEENQDVDTFEQEEEYYTYLLPVSAEGGSLSGFADSVALRDCERIISPISGADFAISVHGDSMAPEYPNGSKVIIKRVNERAFIEWGKAYVLDTCNGVVIKKLMPSSKGEEYVSCVSVNPDYPPFDVCLEDVYRVYRVMLCMSVK